MNKEENILFQYQVKSKTTMGIRYYYFYSKTDIENYLNDKNIKYVRYAKDTALNKKEKRIRELFKENKQLKEKYIAIEKERKTFLKHLDNVEQERDKYKKVIEEVREYIEREDICIDIRDNELNYISTNELLQILDKGESNE